MGLFMKEWPAVSKWGGTYQPTGTGRLKKVSANTSATEKNSCYSL